MNNDLLKRGSELAGFKAKMRILDIGCGSGHDVDHLVRELGVDAEGIDTNLSAIAEAKEKYPHIKVRYGDGEFLDEYMSYTFDGIIMKDSLSLINMPDEALHEAYCVLKKGGKLIIIDKYDRDPDRDKMKAVAIEADRLSRIPHKEGDCEDRGQKLVDFRYEGIFFKDPLIRQIEETGLKVVAFEDATDDEEKFLLVAAKPL